MPPFGGAVRITGERPVEFDSCTFFGNRAHSGGAIHAQGSSPRFVDCLLQANEALASGGAAFFDIFSNPQFEGCGFSSNAAGTVGGALACSESQSLAIHDSHFAGNHAEIDGGGMYLASVNLAAPSGYVRRQCLHFGLPAHPRMLGWCSATQGHHVWSRE